MLGRSLIGTIVIKFVEGAKERGVMRVGIVQKKCCSGRCFQSHSSTVGQTPQSGLTPNTFHRCARHHSAVGPECGVGSVSTLDISSPASTAADLHMPKHIKALSMVSSTDSALCFEEGAVDYQVKSTLPRLTSREVWVGEVATWTLLSVEDTI